MNGTKYRRCPLCKAEHADTAHKLCSSSREKSRRYNAGWCSKQRGDSKCNCCNETAAPNSVSCSYHLAMRARNAATLRQRRRIAAQCVECCCSLAAGDRCETCKLKSVERNRRLKSNRFSGGLCAQRCGERRHPMSHYCQPHAAIIGAQTVKRRARQRQQRLPLVATRILEHLLKEPCYFCGQPAAPVHGIDRFVNSHGYVDGNCCPACKRCNIGKGQQAVAAFLTRSQRVSRRNVQETLLGFVEAPF